MTRRRTAWWASPQVLIGSAVGTVTLGSLVVNFFVADARQSDRVERVEDRVETAEAKLDQQENKVADYYVQQQMVIQDLGYLKEGVKEVLKEMKKR